MFSTERLTLRALKDSDFEKLHTLWNTASVQRTLSFDFTVPVSQSQHNERLPKLVEMSTLFAVIETKEGNDFVGFANLWKLDAKNRSLRYGTALMPQFWGKGYATEVLRFMLKYAFVSLGIHRVQLNVVSGNLAAIAVYKKVGFVEEGRLRDAIWVDGHWEDEMWMGILQHEWLARNEEGSSDPR
ncbi:hypothetical protein VNI00_002469 [Paramarasmius palmivorus]|uniref:N-acetyltransferase domain-containing protein n=1 Tax=Paramarasmius palmivorus TaxID=297713 RepID=A0AAW0DYU9_9AGAR